MSQNDLNINVSGNSPAPQKSSGETSGMSGAFLFRFALRPLFFYVIGKWKWILGAFLISVISFWFIFHYVGNYSSTAWTATAKVFHQARSDKLPTFYKPVGTTSVMQFIRSKSVFSRVSARMNDSPYLYNRGMLSNVEISMGKTKDNIINISASASTPDTAAAIANAVAEEGVSEYVRRQNNSVRIVIDERMKQKAEISREIENLAQEKKKFSSPVTGLSPDLELAKLREEITSLMMKSTDLKIRRNEVNVQTEEIKKTLKTTEQNVEYEVMVEQTSEKNLADKELELQTLLERYTEENPKVKMLQSEISEIKKHEAKLKAKPQTPTKISYRKNSIYENLENQLVSLQLERTTLDSSEMQYKKEIEDKRMKIAELVEVENRFSEIVRRSSMLRDKLTKLDDGINDLEFLISSAVPDVYVFEAASVPWRSNMRKSQLKIAALSLFIALAVAAGFAVFRIARMHLFDSSEFKTALGIDDIGCTPKFSQYPHKIFQSALQKIHHNLIKKMEDAKEMSFIRYGEISDYEKSLDEFLNIVAMQGVSSFRLQCVPVSLKGEEESAPQPEKDDTIASQLVSVAKHFNTGVFKYQNDYSLDVAELDLLKFDLNALAEHYDILILEATADEKNSQAIAQICSLVKYVVVVAPFDKISKLDIDKQIEQIKSLSEAKIGGILADIPKPYFKG